MSVLKILDLEFEISEESPGRAFVHHDKDRKRSWEWDARVEWMEDHWDHRSLKNSSYWVLDMISTEVTWAESEFRMERKKM